MGDVTLTLTALVLPSRLPGWVWREVFGPTSASLRFYLLCTGGQDERTITTDSRVFVTFGASRLAPDAAYNAMWLRLGEPVALHVSAVEGLVAVLPVWQGDPHVAKGAEARAVDVRGAAALDAFTVESFGQRCVLRVPPVVADLLRRGAMTVEAA